MVWSGYGLAGLTGWLAAFAVVEKCSGDNKVFALIVVPASDIWFCMAVNKLIALA